MNFLDVLAKKTVAERALAYAAKVRELATEETGLTEWLYLNSRKGIRRRSSRALTVDSSVAFLSGSSRSISGGFFASIGRKAGVKKDRPLAPASPNKLISSRQTPQPRPVKLGTTPTLPGGPRAPARYAQRAHSVAFNTPEPPRPESQPLSMSLVKLWNRRKPLIAGKDVLAGYPAALKAPEVRFTDGGTGNKLSSREMVYPVCIGASRDLSAQRCCPSIPSTSFSAFSEMLPVLRAGRCCVIIAVDCAGHTFERLLSGYEWAFTEPE
ncbi:hypothetical protein JB92DRAFT_2831994 [Gautieria morchelliformis]|nr:hypothetical protein JB92DRAFT_2831994 [Gautieria morchelliformis]